MEDSVTVRVFDSTRHLRHQFYTLSLLVTQGSLHILQTPARREFHAEKRNAVSALAHLVYRENVWMIEASYCFGLEPKSLQVRFSGPLAQSNDFERDSALETFLPCAIHCALTAATDFFQQFIVTEIRCHF